MSTVATSIVILAIVFVSGWVAGFTIGYKLKKLE